MYSILKLNEIANCAEKVLADGFTMSADEKNPDGIILRSFSMHDFEAGVGLLAVARAGAGVNNIPIEKMTGKGICVFNTPGANANAVKELVICALLLGSRKIVTAINWAQGLAGQENVAKTVEKGKNAFVGAEIAGKTLGVIGLGAIGRMVANAAVGLDMQVLGYDPFLSVDGAWSLSRAVKHVKNLQEIYANCDYITLHVPATDDTKGFINENSIAEMKDGVVIVNAARGELVKNADIKAAVASGKVGRYVTDFPTEEVLGVENIIPIPHLGASSPEAEDNCAVMAATQLKDFLEAGNIVNSVNLPTSVVPKAGKFRVTIIHKNVANMLNKATGIFSANGVNIENMSSVSKGEIAYTVLDVNTLPSEKIKAEFLSTPEFLKVRFI